MRLWMLLAGSLAVIGKENSSLKLENLVKPECYRNRGGDCRFFGTSSNFFGLARTLICNWQRPAVSFTLAEYHASGSGIQFNLTFAAQGIATLEVYLGWNGNCRALFCLLCNYLSFTTDRDNGNEWRRKLNRVFIVALEGERPRFSQE